MKLRELKNELNNIKIESSLDDDIVLECGHKKFHVLYAKRENYNKRDEKFTPRVFVIVGVED